MVCEKAQRLFREVSSAGGPLGDRTVAKKRGILGRAIFPYIIDRHIGVGALVCDGKSVRQVFLQEIGFQTPTLVRSLSGKSRNDMPTEKTSRRSSSAYS